MTINHRLPLAALVGLTLAFGSPSVQADAFDEAARDEIREIVREYLLENPDVVLEALREMERRTAAAQDEERRTKMAALKSQIFDDPMTPVSGNAEGDVTVVEFFDYQCGYCKRMFPAMMSVREDDPNVRIVWKELPILGPVSRFASEAAMAAAKQDKYLEFHTALMGHRGRLSEEIVLQRAQSVGLDIDRLQADMKSDEIQSYLDGNLELARTLQISGTPAMIIGDKLVPGAVSNRSRSSSRPALMRIQRFSGATPGMRTNTSRAINSCNTRNA